MDSLGGQTRVLPPNNSLDRMDGDNMNVITTYILTFMTFVLAVTLSTHNAPAQPPLRATLDLACVIEVPDRLNSCMCPRVDPPFFCDNVLVDAITDLAVGCFCIPGEVMLMGDFITACRVDCMGHVTSTGCPVLIVECIAEDIPLE